MKRLALSFLAVLICLPFTYAQNNQRMKLADIVAEHEKELQQAGGSNLLQKNDPREISESGDFQFQRWLEYARYQTDTDGYIVSPAQAWDVLKKYQQSTNGANKTTAALQANWSFFGPKAINWVWQFRISAGQGRINTMDFHPTDKNTFWIGSSSGGAWKTTNFGNTWTCMTDNLPHIVAVSDIDINPKNPNTIYLCTGDREAIALGVGGNTGGPGVGLLKSTNGGLSWDTTGYKFDIKNDNVFTNSLVINPKDTNSLTMATNKGIFKSYNGGQTWNNVTPSWGSGVNLINVWEVLYHPTDTNILYSNAWVVRTADSLLALRSVDGGKTWSRIKTMVNVQRGAMAVSKSTPHVVKMITSYGLYQLSGLGGHTEGIYSSADSGKTYTTIAHYNPFDANGNLFGITADGHTINGQGVYDITMVIDPANANHLIVGGSLYSWESYNGGVSWSIFNQDRDPNNNFPNIQLIHADKHFMAYHPLDSTYFFECNDGGVYFKKNVLWQYITPGLGVTQYYTNAVSKDGKYVVAGAQDNGCHLIRSNGNSEPVMTGDGQEVQVDFNDTNTIYVSSQNGNFYRNYIPKADSILAVGNNIPVIKPKYFYVPLIVNPLNQNNLIAAYDTIYSSTDRGDSWNKISPYLGPINCLDISPANPSYIYAVNYAFNGSNHDIIFTKDGGSYWQYNTHPFPENNVSDIKVDAKKASHFWITFGGWSNTNMVAEFDSATGWKSISENLPPIPVYCIEQDSSDGTLYIGTYDGIYYRPVDSTQWQPYRTNLPHVDVRDLGISYVSGQIFAATWGRAMWVSPKYNKYLGVYRGIPYAYKQLELYPNPANDKFTVVSDVNQFNDNDVRVSLIDTKGQVVLQQQNTFKGNKMELSGLNLPNGVYVLHISKDGVYAKARVVIIK
jgi:photosystem II stability/assembly factor-like uncharacterized protein